MDTFLKEIFLIAKIMNKSLVSIIVPVFNEKNTIDQIIKRVEELDIEKEIIIIDDSSTDGTVERLKAIRGKNPKIRLIFHEKNYGKGRCIRDGFKEATGDIAIIQDADLEYNPKEIPKVIQPIIDGYADVVYGSRFAGYPRRALYFWHSIGNNILTLISNIFTNLNLTDMETCYKAFKKVVYKNIKLVSDKFEIEPELTAKVARMKMRIYEVPVSYQGRSYWEGKKIKWVDGIKAIFAIIRHSLFSKISDDIGFQTLELMSASESYNRLIYGQIEPYIGQRILEIGSGIGNITKFMLSKDFVHATDISDSYLHILSNSFGNCPNLNVQKLNLENFNDTEIKKLNIDTIVCLNVLEHIKDDVAALKKIASILEPGGKLVLLVPAHNWAYSNLDSKLGHFRRYTKSLIIQKSAEAGFKILKMDSFNAIGLPGWFISGKILRRTKLSRLQIRLFDLTVPFLKLEKLFGPPFGLSTIAILEKE